MITKYLIILALSTATLLTFTSQAKSGVETSESGYTCVTVTPKGGKVNIRANAGTNFRVIGSVPFNETVSVGNASRKDRQGQTWYPVQFGEIKGWVRSDFLSCPENP